MTKKEFEHWRTVAKDSKEYQVTRFETFEEGMLSLPLYNIIWGDDYIRFCSKEKIDDDIKHKTVKRNEIKKLDIRDSNNDMIYSREFLLSHLKGFQKYRYE